MNFTPFVAAPKLYKRTKLSHGKCRCKLEHKNSRSRSRKQCKQWNRQIETCRAIFGRNNRRWGWRLLGLLRLSKSHLRKMIWAFRCYSSASVTAPYCTMQCVKVQARYSAEQMIRRRLPCQLEAWRNPTKCQLTCNELRTVCAANWYVAVSVCYWRCSPIDTYASIWKSQGFNAKWLRIFAAQLPLILWTWNTRSRVSGARFAHRVHLISSARPIHLAFTHIASPAMESLIHSMQTRNLWISVAHRHHAHRMATNAWVSNGHHKFYLAPNSGG